LRLARSIQDRENFPARRERFPIQTWGFSTSRSGEGAGGDCASERESLRRYCEALYRLGELAARLPDIDCINL
jgi:hypothetical protein